MAVNEPKDSNNLSECLSQPMPPSWAPALERWGLAQWLPILERLIDHFEGWSWLEAELPSVHEEVSALLWRLDSPMDDMHFAGALAQLDCWGYAVERDAHSWTYGEAPLTTFLNAGIRVYEMNDVDVAQRRSEITQTLLMQLCMERIDQLRAQSPGEPGQVMKLLLC